MAPPTPAHCPDPQAVVSATRPCRRRGEVGERRLDVQRKWAAQLEAAREAERRRLALDMHDECGQHFVAIQLALAQLMGDEAEPWVRQVAQRVSSHVESSVAAVRQLLAGLRPQLLEDLGLPAALHRLGQDAERRLGLAVSVQAIEAAAAWPPVVALALYRIAQESLTNAARHANATAVCMTLAGTPQRAQLVVEDDGIGLPAAAGSTAGALGLRGMHERTAMLGGTFHAEPRLGGGTRLSALVPLRAHQVSGEPAPRGIGARR
jgi:two-component system sensor histidine kinase UhpB